MDALPGVTVADLTHASSGLHAAFLVAVLGAAVIKIEDLGTADLARAIFLTPTATAS